MTTVNSSDTQAVILAAGLGSRLGELTKDVAKCMIPANGVTLIQRILIQLDELEVSRIVLVVGYKADKLIKHISDLSIKTEVLFVYNDRYDKTNNIYSLYLARKYLCEMDTLLLESDLILGPHVLCGFLRESDPNLVLVAQYENWMDGTVVTLDDKTYQIQEFIDKKHFRTEDINKYYKTVNIYKFSREFITQYYLPFLDSYCRFISQNEYYEIILRMITVLKIADIFEHISLKAIPVGSGDVWYERDDVTDLRMAESLFLENTTI